MRITATFLVVAILAACGESVEIGLDRTEGVPPELEPFPVSPLHHPMVYPPAQSREDFRTGALECVAWLKDPDYPLCATLENIYATEEFQTEIHRSMLAKEAAYGVGAVETLCEKEILKIALSLVRREGSFPNTAAQERLERWLGVTDQ